MVCETGLAVLKINAIRKKGWGLSGCMCLLLRCNADDAITKPALMTADGWSRLEANKPPTHDDRKEAAMARAVMASQSHGRQARAPHHLPPAFKSSGSWLWQR